MVADAFVALGNYQSYVQIEIKCITLPGHLIMENQTNHRLF